MALNDVYHCHCNRRKGKKWLDVHIKMERVTSAIKTVGAFGQDKLRSSADDKMQQNFSKH